MRISARKRKTIALGFATAMAPMALTIATATAAEATASSAACAKVIVIVVRGSLEPAGTGTASSGNVYKTGGFGISIGAANGVQAGTSLTVRKEAVIYPAAIAPTWNDPGGYLVSTAKGRHALGTEIEYLNHNCSTATKIVMIGYSQGAQVIGDVLDKTTPQQLSSSAKSRIKAVVFFGDPEFLAGEPFDYGTYVRTQSGTFPRGKGNLSAFAGIIRSYCSKGDQYCQDAGSKGATVHQSYKSSTFQNAAAAFILGKL